MLDIFENFIKNQDFKIKRKNSIFNIKYKNNKFLHFINGVYLIVQCF